MLTEKPLKAQDSYFIVMIITLLWIKWEHPLKTHRDKSKGYKSQEHLT